MRRPARPACCQVEATLPGIAHQHRRVEAADVDAELERVRRDDAQHRPLAQPPLDLAPLERQVAAAVAADHALRARLRLERLLEVGHEHLGREARGREHDRLQPLAEERQRDVARRVERRAADAELAVHDRRVVDREVALAARRAALVDERHLALGEALGQLPGCRSWPTSRGTAAASRRTRTAAAAAGGRWRRASRTPRAGCAARRPPRSAGSRTASPTSCGAAGCPCAACRGSSPRRARARGSPCARPAACRRRR